VIERISAEGLNANVGIETHATSASRSTKSSRTQTSGACSSSEASSGSTWNSRSSWKQRCASTAGFATSASTTSGTVLQAYLYRTPDDLESLLPLAAEPAARQGRVSRAGASRVSPEGRRRRHLRETPRANAPGRRAHRRRNPRRAADRADDPLRSCGGNLAGALRVPDALRRATTAAARPRPPRLQGARRNPVWPRVVPVPDASPGRATPRTCCSF